MPYGERVKWKISAENIDEGLSSFAGSSLPNKRRVAGRGRTLARKPIAGFIHSYRAGWLSRIGKQSEEIVQSASTGPIDISRTHGEEWLVT